MKAPQSSSQSKSRVPVGSPKTTPRRVVRSGASVRISRPESSGSRCGTYTVMHQPRDRFDVGKAVGTVYKIREY